MTNNTQGLSPIFLVHLISVCVNSYSLPVITIFSHIGGPCLIESLFSVQLKPSSSL